MDKPTVDDSLTRAAETSFSEDELRRLFDLLAVPSVSADEAAAGDLRRAAELCAVEVEQAGGQVEIRQTERNPLVLGSVPASAGGDSAPRVLVYGHYDVQAADPIDAWDSPPFSPTVRDGYLHCRGANDDKGQLFALLVALQRLRDEDRLPVEVTVLIDGEEEIGGTSAPAAIAELTEPLSAALVFDAPTLAPGRPAFYVASRGLVLVRLDVKTGLADAHSGHFGGAAMNAAHVLSDILGTVLPRGGRLPPALEADVAPPSDEERRGWTGLPGGAEMLHDAGLVAADPDATADFYERTTAAPALDVHTLVCGSEHAKTVVATSASAKLSIRLAPGQRADRITETLRSMLLGAAPQGADVAVTPLIAADPALTDPADPVILAGAKAVESVTGVRPRSARLGGTVPLLAELSRRGVPAILTGFHDADDATHSPNERISLSALRTALDSAGAILASLG